MKTILALILTSVAAFSIDVAWDPRPAAEVVTEYRVYEKTGTAAAPIYTKIGTVAAAAASKFTLVNPDKSKPHTYVVTAVNLAGEGPYGNEVVLPALPGSPANVKVTVTFDLSAPGQ